jgi:FixJ family two-component response regulator
MIFCESKGSITNQPSFQVATAMNTIWCPVRFISGDCDLTEKIRNISMDLGVTDFQAFSKLGQGLQQESLAQVVLIDLHGGSSPESANENMTQAMKRSPRDVVVGIGAGFRGSEVANWARQGMHSLVDSPFERHDFEMALIDANKECVSLRIVQSELRMLRMQRRSITEREEDVLELVVQGVPNKCIASRLEVSQRTIESRRQKIYQKMNAKRLTDLIRALDKLEFLSQTLSHANA